MEPIQIKRLPEGFVLRLSGAKVVLPPALRSKIEQHWQVRVSANGKLTNGEVFTVTDVLETATGTEIVLAETNYAHYLYSDQIGGLGKYAVRIIHTAALIITSDNQLIFGSMGKHTSCHGVIQPSGGGFDHKDVRNGVVDVEHNLASELSEELGVDLYDQAVVADFSSVYLTYGGSTGKMGVCYLVYVKQTSAEFLKLYDDFAERLEAAGEDPEFEQLISLDASQAAVDAFITAHADRLQEFMPVLLRMVARL